jgi:uncharacterized membrane protein
MATKTIFKDKDMQVVLGWVLRVGVIVSVSIVFIGGVIFLERHGQTIANHQQFKGIPDFIRTLPGIIRGVIDIRGQAIIQLGIILLIATPILRVIFSAIGFVLERDYLYVVISLLVLLIIFASMFSGHAG